MIEERIGEIRIRVRTDISDAHRVRSASERVVRAALERCAVLLEERAPGRIVLIRRLPLRWRFDESMFDEEAQVEELAAATADVIERVAALRAGGAGGASTHADTGDDAAVFDDEAHLRASFLASLARGGPEWFHAALEDEGSRPLAVLAAPEKRAIALATLTRLADDNVLVDVLAAQPAADVAMLADALGFDDDDLPVQTDVSPMVAASLAAAARAWPWLPPATLSLALRIHAAVVLDADADAAPAAALASAARVTIDSSQSSASETRGTAPAVTPSARDEDAATMPAEDVEEVTSRCVGLFYLLDRVQELDLGQSLWNACLPEGAVLAAAMSALLGRQFRDDRAPALFGGVSGNATCPPVTAEQHADVAITTCAGVAQAVPRRGLVDFPSIVVKVAGQATGRCLTAVPEGSPFAFFAWPATTPDALRTGLEALLATWPHRGTIHAEPALVMLDVSGRLRPWQQPPPSPFLPDAPSVEAAALLALTAGATSMLFALRAGHAVPYDAPGFVRDHLARPGRVRLADDWMDVVLDADAIDINLRRAALDRDPGWVPWLHRTVRFTFEEMQRAGETAP